MRGFSNRAFAAPLPETPEPPLDIARRFAPERPTVVVSNPEPLPRASEDELAMLLNLAGKSFAQGFRCLWGIKRVLVTRAKLRLRLAYHRIMQARFLPWALAGGGWGCSLGLAVLLMVAR